jgi:hypothetical protein
MANVEENARRKAAGNKEIPLSPIAIEVLRRIDALFEIERSINGKSAEERVQVRQTLSRQLVAELQVYTDPTEIVQSTAAANMLACRRRNAHTAPRSIRPT